jgi:hypothetical protein
VALGAILVVFEMIVLLVVLVGILVNVLLVVFKTPFALYILYSRYIPSIFHIFFRKAWDASRRVKCGDNYL